MSALAEIAIQENPAVGASQIADRVLSPIRTSRLPCVDILRGAAMIVMALDHTRSFFTGASFAPEDIAHGSAAVFFTRWITHFCAPAFFLLAGTGAYLSLWQGRSIRHVSRFLWTRGLWLVFLDLSVIAFGWTSEFPLFSGVLWSLGWCMVLMAVLVKLPVRWIVTFGAAIIVGHNLLDRIRPESLGWFGPLWMVLYGYGSFWIIPGKLSFFVLWPIIPWVGVMALGFVLGSLLMHQDWKKRCVWVGLATTVAFVVLRLFNLYGNSDASRFGFAAGPWSIQRTAALTVSSFLDTLKYPASLQFLLMTLGPLLIALAVLGRVSGEGKIARFVAVFGRVPLFFYVVHIFLIRTLAIYTAMLFKQKAAWLLYGGFMLNVPPAGYGHGLPFVYAMWGLAVLAMYPFCKIFMNFKRAHPEWVFLRYL